MDSLLTAAMKKNVKITSAQRAKAVAVLSSPKARLTIENVYKGSKHLFSLYRVSAKANKRLTNSMDVLSCAGFRFMTMDVGQGYVATSDTIDEQVEMAFSTHPDVQSVNKDIDKINDAVKELYCSMDYRSAVSVIYQGYSSRDLILDTYIKHILDTRGLIGGSIRSLQALATIRDDKLIVRIYLTNSSRPMTVFEPIEVEFPTTVKSEDIWDYNIGGCKILVMLDLVSDGKITHEIFDTIRHYNTTKVTEKQAIDKLIDYKLKVSELLIKSKATTVDELRSLLIKI